jgi:transaldolase
MKALLKTGTRVWLDSVNPRLLEAAIKAGATGATSNPVIVKECGYEAILAAERLLLPIWERTQGNDGWVCYELDPHIERLPANERVEKYVRDGVNAHTGHRNRMIKVPATVYGAKAIAQLLNYQVPVCATLIFGMEQYNMVKREVLTCGANYPRICYAPFIGRLERKCKGWGWALGRRMYAANRTAPGDILFASMYPWDVSMLSGGGIMTLPPATLEAIKDRIHYHSQLNNNVAFHEEVLLSRGLEQFQEAAS